MNLRVLLLVFLGGCAHAVVPKDMAHAQAISECLVEAGYADELQIPEGSARKPACRERWWAAAHELERRSICEADDECVLASLQPGLHGGYWITVSRSVFEGEAYSYFEGVQAACGHFYVVYYGRKPSARCVKGRCRIPGYPKMRVPRDSNCSDAAP